MFSFWLMSSIFCDIFSTRSLVALIRSSVDWHNSISISRKYPSTHSSSKSYSRSISSFSKNNFSPLSRGKSSPIHCASISCACHQGYQRRVIASQTGGGDCGEEKRKIACKIKLLCFGILSVTDILYLSLSESSISATCNNARRQWTVVGVLVFVDIP